MSDGSIEQVALQDIAAALQGLGVNDAATRMGALELLALEIKEASERIAEALEHVGFAIMAGHDSCTVAGNLGLCSYDEQGGEQDGKEDWRTADADR